MCKARSSDVDGRCDGEEDECQGSESGNKPLRHCVKEDVSLEYFTLSISKDSTMQ